MAVALWVVVVLSLLAADARWVRVAQREHYYAGRPLVVARIWCRARPENAVLVVVAVALAVLGLWWRPASFVGALAAAVWPLGLSVRSTSSALAWTPRLRRLAICLGLVELVLALVCWVVLPPLAALLPALVPALTALALAAVTPIERRLSSTFVVAARRRLAEVRPTVVGITGSYGKTSTKGYVAHLVSGSHSVVASPASFNNIMGLARTVNERLVPGTDVFVAEMGTYGPGEIRELCEVFPPRIAAITTIGEAHLERMHTRAVIAAAKAEITERAEIVVLNVDVPELRELADRLAGSKRVVRCATSDDARPDVVVDATGPTWRVAIDGEPAGEIPALPGAHPGNLAVAVGVARALDIPASQVAARLAGLPSTEHRAEAHRSADGVLVIDDTYNSNPSGAATALAAALDAAGADGTVYVVTPGMVELGSKQTERNREFAAAVTSHPNTRLAVVGRTNRRALLAGARAGTVTVHRTRQRATEAVTALARVGDVLLFENDLPDHYP